MFPLSFLDGHQQMFLFNKVPILLQFKVFFWVATHLFRPLLSIAPNFVSHFSSLTPFPSPFLSLPQLLISPLHCLFRDLLQWLLEVFVIMVVAISVIIVTIDGDIHHHHDGCWHSLSS
jgi:hypothetical protein